MRQQDCSTVAANNVTLVDVVAGELVSITPEAR